MVATTTYLIRVAPSPGFDQRHEARRLARFLKSAQRAFGFRCLACVREEPARREEQAA